jgi:multidrug efflux pump subunit AcrB
MSKGFNLSAWALEHKSFVGFVMVMCVFAGVLAYGELGRDEDPPFTIKTMIVRAFWPGATADETARQLTDRIEKQLESLQWIDYTKSYSKPGEATIFVNLRDNTPPDAVPEQWYQVRKKTADIRQTLPDGVVGPFFNDDFGDVYGVIYAFTSDGFSYRELRDAVEDVRAELLRVPDVGKVDLIGAQNELINVDFSLRQLAGLGIDVNTIAETLRSQNAVIASGTLETASERIAVRVSGQFDSVASLAAITIRANDRLIRLRDIARITRGYEDPPKVLFRLNGEPAIGLGISMSKGGNILDMGEYLHAEMARIQRDLPVGIDAHLVVNQPHVVEESVGEFTKALTEAIVIVLIVSFVSLGMRAGVVVAVSIPLVLAITFVIMDAAKIDLQRISLGALVIALGLLVDDAMIAVEMMVRKLEEGWDKFKAATFAYTSTAFPMLTGTLVSIAGFMPVGFAKSGAGEYCFSLFVVVAIALLTSWFVAVLFAPYVGVAILKEQIKAAGPQPTERRGRMMRWFRDTLILALRHRALVIIATVAAFAFSVVLFRFVPQQFFPASDRPELLVDLKLPQYASIEATRAEVERFEKVLAKDPGVESYSFYVGSGAVRFYLPLNAQLENANFAQAVVITKGFDVRPRVRARLEKVLEEQFDLLMGRVQPLQLGPPVDWPIQYRVMGKDLAEVRRIAEQVASVVRANPNTRIINFDWNERSKSVLIDIDQDKARRLGVSSEQLARALNSTLTGRVVTQLRDDIYLIDIRGRAIERDRADLQSLRDLEVGVPGGASIPLAQIAKFRYGQEESIIWRRERLPTITVQADLLPGAQAATIVQALEQPIAAVRAKLLPGYRVEVGGTVDESSKGQGSIFAVVPVMAVLMLVILMVQLQSVQKLIMVMLTAPLGLIGVSLSLLITNRPFGFVALLGVFALTGMIIRNSVVLMAQIHEYEKEGMNRWDAIVDATEHRLRPILLTAAAAILGLIPIAGEVFWGPMAFAMMGGLLVATVLTLIFLPALYAAWFRVREPDAAAAVNQ